MGMEILLRELGPRDWIGRVDDDLPHDLDNDVIREQMLLVDDLGACVGAIGVRGARFDERRARLTSPARLESRGHIEVDYIPTGFLPIYSVAAIREVGVFRGDYFFGFEEVEFGLRLKNAGWRVIRLDRPSHFPDSGGQTRSLPSPTSWRDYYSLRNLIVLAHDYCGPTVVPRVLARAVARLFWRSLSSPSSARERFQLFQKAVRDGLTGQMGRQLEPRLNRHGNLGLRA
jgi:GT2 family glycosyltransferase